MSAKSEASDVLLMTTHPGWAVLTRHINEEVAKGLKELRQFGRQDNTKRVIGISRYLDGLEHVYKLIEIIKQRGELE